jgi:hypothetical protein
MASYFFFLEKRRRTAPQYIKKERKGSERPGYKDLLMEAKNKHKENNP